jgi:hypothetical protein
MPINYRFVLIQACQYTGNSQPRYFASMNIGRGGDWGFI